MWVLMGFGWLWWVMMGYARVNFLTLTFENGSLIHKKNELYIEFRHFFIKQRNSRANR